MACGADRLLDLPDDLLLRILHFAPAKEAASTTALSRGWRSPLWRSSGAVNLETLIEDYRPCCAKEWCRAHNRKQPDEALFFSRRDAFVSATEAALDAADVPITRLTLRLELVGREDSIDMFLHRDRVDDDNYYDSDSDSDRTPWPDRDVLGKLLSHRAARQVEELRLAAEAWNNGRTDSYTEEEEEITPCDDEGMFTLCLGSLPSETLRVLEITGCYSLTPSLPASAVVFPRLCLLRLRHCTVLIEALQSVIDAAPALTAIHLESVTIPQQHEYPYRTTRTQTARFRCAAATMLVLDRCNWKVKPRPWPHYHHDTEHVVLAVEIDAPKLQRFRYKGTLRPVSLSPPPPDLARADLHFSDQKRKSDTDLSREIDLVTFWRFLQSLPSVRELKLRVTALEHIAVLTKARRHELLPVLSNPHRLELKGLHRPKGKTAAVAIADLLRCCPALRDLLINLTVAHHHEPLRGEDVFLERKSPSDGDNNTCIFNLHSNSTLMTANHKEVSEIPGLSHCSFDCLRSSLMRVALRFRLQGEANCFGVKLIKFFADNAVVLEEMLIDGRDEKLDKHMNYKAERWIADSSIVRKHGASGFLVSPLKRRL